MLVFLIGRLWKSRLDRYSPSGLHLGGDGPRALFFSSKTVSAFAYGALLILAAFVSNKVTEAFRIDALFLSKPTEATRKINLVAGAAIIAYNIYTLS